MEQQNETKYSVLMAVYHKEEGPFFNEALESIWAQTIPTNDFVLICDGPLTDELNQIIDANLLSHPNTMNVIRLPENKGLGNALSIGGHEV